MHPVDAALIGYFEEHAHEVQLPEMSAELRNKLGMKEDNHATSKPSQSSVPEEQQAQALQGVRRCNSEWR